MKFFCVLVIVLLSANTAYAEDTESGWTSGSAMDTGFNYNKDSAYFLKLVKKKHAVLVESVKNTSAIGDNERIVAALQSQQEAWLKYYPEECSLVGPLKQAGGTWPSTYVVRCENGMIYNRYRSLKSAIKCINTQHSATCLYQLAPLSNL